MRTNFYYRASHGHPATFANHDSDSVGRGFPTAFDHQSGHTIKYTHPTRFINRCTTNLNRYPYARANRS